MISKVSFILILLSYVARQQGSNGECNLSSSFIFQTGYFEMPVENQSEFKKMLGRTTSWHHMLRHLDCHYLTLHTYLTTS